uniref:2-C-methyl-D-erythritol 4-phosphate cytidylyltransferase n=1 Tax=Zeugodacus cucurbitae TaxID=28588 RepID=A0A0A1X9Y0_ZEUCU
MEMRLLTLILVWFMCSGQAAPIMEANAMIVAESESTDNPATSSNINSDTSSDSNLQIADKQDVNLLSAGNAVDEEAAAAAERMATAIVAPLTHIAHVTYDSEPATHKPNADKPLFHREPHDELIAL